MHGNEEETVSGVGMEAYGEEASRMAYKEMNGYSGRSQENRSIRMENGS